jgi:hypothetical protein
MIRPPWEYGLPEGRATPSPSVEPTHPKVNARRARTTVTTNQLIIISAHTLYLSKRSRKKKDDCHNIAPWSTAHARPAPPPSFFYLDLIILFVIIVGVGVNVSGTEKSPRCARKRLCCPHARRYIRTKCIRTIRSATLRSSRLSVLSTLPLPPSLPLYACRAFFYFFRSMESETKIGFFYVQRISNR